MTVGVNLLNPELPSTPEDRSYRATFGPDLFVVESGLSGEEFGYF